MGLNLGVSPDPSTALHSIPMSQHLWANQLLWNRKPWGILAIPLSCIRVCLGLPNPRDSHIHLSKRWPAYPASLSTPSRNNATSYGPGVMGALQVQTSLNPPNGGSERGGEITFDGQVQGIKLCSRCCPFISLFSPPNNPLGRRYGCPHFADGEPKGLRGERSCPAKGTHRW